MTGRTDPPRTSVEILGPAVAVGFLAGFTLGLGLPPRSPAREESGGLRVGPIPFRRPGRSRTRELGSLGREIVRAAGERLLARDDGRAETLLQAGLRLRALGEGLKGR